MSIGYLVAVIFSFVIGVWVYSQYSLNCRCHSKDSPNHTHGAGEGWLTTIGLNLLLMYFIGGSKPGGWWIGGVIGAGLLLFVARRFWLNWEHKA